jgi:hypothetical protein
MQWLKQLFTRRQIHSDLSDEIQQHLAEKIAALIADGMSPKEAAYAARREFGNVTGIEESGREAWTWPRAESILSDVKFAIRKLKKSPGFATTAILTLALGIGANVVVFSVVNGLILRPLDVPEPATLFQVVHGKDFFNTQSYRDYLDYRDRDPSFSGMLAYGFMRVGLRAGKTAVQGWGHAVSGNYFDVLGVQPASGHFFHAADEHGPASAPYIVLSYDFWRLHFDSNPHILGETIELNQHPFTVIGVARKDFHGTEVFFVADYWIPLVNEAQVTGFEDLPYRDHYAFTVLGRLKPGVTPQQATRSLNVLAAQMAREDPKDDGLTALVRKPGPAEDEQDPTKKALLGILLLAILVLLAACANLASIFAARATDRGGELAIRLAIGASRWMILASTAHGSRHRFHGGRRGWIFLRAAVARRAQPIADLRRCSHPLHDLAGCPRLSGRAGPRHRQRHFVRLATGPASMENRCRAGHQNRLPRNRILPTLCAARCLAGCPDCGLYAPGHSLAG